MMIIKMPYTEIPEALKSAGLNLEQANVWAKYYDSIKEKGNVDDPAAIAWTSFKQKYKKVGDKWVANGRVDDDVGTIRRLFGRTRDVIAMKLFGKKFDGLSEEQKDKVHETATAEHSINICVGNSIGHIENGICKFSIIAQTEGIHTGVSGRKVEYTKELFDKFGHTLVGVDISDNPGHLDTESGYKKIVGSNFANIIDTEIIKINEEMINKYEIDKSLAGKYALVAHAEGYKSDYNYMLSKKKIKYYSSELSYTGTKDKNGVWHPDTIRYDGMVALSNPGADPGAIMLGVYNAKYGGNNMEDKLSKLEADLELIKTENAKLQEDKDTIVAEKDKLQKDKEELDVKYAKLEDSKTDTEKTLVELNTKSEELNSKVVELEKSKLLVDELNSKIKGMRDVERTKALGDITSNADIIKGIVGSDLDDKAFNAKLAEIVALREEAKKEVENSTGGVVEIENYSKPDEFKKEWNGMTLDDMVKEITGGVA